MGYFYQTFNYSIGKKLIMALTGFFLIVFLIVHLFGNIFLYFGRDAFNQYVHTLNESGLKYVIKVIEVILALGFLIHFLDGVRLWIQNRMARPVPYKVYKPDPNSSMASRNMIVTAAVIFFFLVLHLQNFWYKFHFVPKEGGITDYDIVVQLFRMPFYSILYILCMVLLAFHLWHGFQSAFQTLGLNHKRYTPIIKFLGKLYAIIIPLGFASFPLYYLFGGN